MPHPKAPTSTLGPPNSASAVDISSWHGRPARDLPSPNNHGRAARATTDNQSPATKARSVLRMFGSPRSGFTLIELLVVIGILVVLAGIGYGAILSTRRQEAHRAIVALVSDFIRQARHTAMSSGAPVEAVIFDDEGKGRIRGFTQVTIVGEQFETLATDQKVPGHSGYGCAIGRTNPNDASSTATFDPFDIPSSASQPIAILLKPSTTSTGPTSFYLECNVCPLPVLWPNSASFLPNRSLTAVSLMEGATEILGIGLSPIDYSIVPPDPNQTAIRNWQYKVFFDSTSITYPDISIPSGTWIRIGVLWREDWITLFVDGRQTTAVAFPLTISDSDFENLKLTIGGQPTISAGIVDNVRLYRLGGGEDFPLPAGFVPYQDYHVQFTPEGSVTGNQNLVFHSERTGRTEEIGVTISSTGSLSSTTATFE